MNKLTMVASTVIGITAVGAAALAHEARKRNQSASSLFIETGLRLYPFPKITSAASPQFDKVLAESAEPYLLPQSLKYCGFFQTPDDNVITYTPTDVTAESPTIVYLHGGAYWTQPSLYSFLFIRDIAERTTARVVMPIYPKAPTHDVTDAMAFVSSVWAQVSSSTTSPLVLMGDSAGGGLALGLVQKLIAEKAALPDGIIVTSPWLDAGLTNQEISTRQAEDPFLDAQTLRFQGKVYAGSVGVNHPWASPLRGDFAKAPRITVLTGTHDILNPDALSFAAKAQERNWPVTTFEYPGMNHLFAAYPTPEGRDARQLIASVINRL